MPLMYLMIPPATVLIIVFLTELPNILDAMTTRYRAVTDRKTQLGHCHSCGALLSLREIEPSPDEPSWRRWLLPWRRGKPPSASS